MKAIRYCCRHNWEFTSSECMFCEKEHRTLGIETDEYVILRKETEPQRQGTLDQLRAWMAIAALKASPYFDLPHECQICGRVGNMYVEVIAHHWRGYEYPLDVWWVCPSCHKKLRDNGVDHSGKTTLEEAKRIIGAIA